MDGDSGAGRKRLTRAEAKARTRQLLLAAAAHTFARRGYASASVEEIAEEAGFSIGALYSNFGGKEQLFTELLSRHASEQVQAATRIVAHAQAGSEDPVRALGRMLVKDADKDSDFTLLQAEMWLYAVRKPELMETLAAQLRETNVALQRLMDAPLERVGGRSDVSSTAVATIALALYQGLVRQRTIDPDSVPEELFGQAMRWLLAGIAADTSEAFLLPQDMPPQR